MSIARSSMIWFIARILSIIIGFISLSYFAHALGAKLLGIYYLFLSVQGILYTISNAGIGGAVEKRMSEKRSQSEFFTASLILNIFSIIAISIIIFIFNNEINNYLGISLTIPLIIILSLNQFSAWIVAVLFGEHKVAASALVELFRDFSKLITQIIVIFIGFGVYGLIVGVGIGYLASIFVGILLIDAGLSKPDRWHYSRLLDFSKYTWIDSVTGYLYQWLNILVLGLFFSSNIVGIYGVYWSISSVVLISAQAISSSIYPKISEAAINKNSEYIETIFKDSIIFSMFLTIPSIAGLVLFAKPLLYFYAGNDFINLSYVFIILCLARLFEAIQYVLGSFIKGFDKPKLIFRTTVIASATNLLGNFILIYFFGVIGAGIATFLTVFVTFLLYFIYIKSFKMPEIPKKELTYEIGSTSLMLVSLYILENIFSPFKLINLIPMMFAGLIIYLTSMYVLSLKVRSLSLKMLSS